MNLRLNVTFSCVGFALLVAACSSDSPGFGGPDAGSGGESGETGGAGGANVGGTTGGTASGSAGGGNHGGGTGGKEEGGASNAGATGNGGAGGKTGTGGMPGGGGRSLDASLPDAGDASALPDGGSAEGGDGSLPVNDAGMHRKRIFITHDRWDGDLKHAAEDLGIDVTTGIAAADALCNLAATDAGLGGTWVAWLSDGSDDALDRVKDVGPWYRVDGAEVFADKAALVGNPLVAIELDESGDDTELVPDGGGLANVPWTGTLADGTRSLDTCNDWSSNADDVHGLAGANTATTDAKWSEGTAPLCDRPYHLYCFEQ